MDRKKILPGTPQYALTWENRIAGGIQFLVELKDLPAKMKDKWTVGNERHYRELVMNLIAHPPKGCQRKAKAFAKKLETI